MEAKRAMLVVSFGTSHNDSREKTIDRIEETLREVQPEMAFYRGWTSGMIIRKLKKRDNMTVMTVTEAMEQIVADGITHLVVQPTHVINGIENDLMKEHVLAFADRLEEIRFGDPLLTSVEDQEAVVEAVTEEFQDVAEDEALVLMGHGSDHFANTVYAAMDYMFKDKGHPHIYMGTVEGYPYLESVMRLLKDSHIRKVVLAPFMVVAGDHANNDMAGDDEDSWKNQFEREGFEVRCIIKGLGEYPGIRRLYAEHMLAALREEKTV